MDKLNDQENVKTHFAASYIGESEGHWHIIEKLPTPRNKVLEGGYRYLFVFYHIMDLNKVLEGGPWSFEQNALVFTRLLGTEDPQGLQLNDMDIWVQIYDLLKDLISEHIMKSVGNFIGSFVKADPTNLEDVWKPFVRIRVKMNVLKPMKRRLKIKREGGEWSVGKWKSLRHILYMFLMIFPKSND